MTDNPADTPTMTAASEEDFAVINEQRNWLIDYHRQLGSWAQVAKRLGVPQGTVSTFATGKYNGGPYAGGNRKIADGIARFRQMQAAQASIDVAAPVRPGFFETETSRNLEQLLKWSQRGKLTVAALGPGLGKTMSAKNFRACYANVFLATMTPSSAGVNTMQIEVLESLGDKNAVGTPQKLSRRVRERVEQLATPLLIIDEAQHLSQKAIEEIRSWHDAVGLGIALLGNISVMQRLEGGSRSDAFAQLYSRVSLKMLRNLPLNGDIEPLAEAWKVHDEATIAFLRDRICSKPGGLRNGTHALELAYMIASANGEPLALAHLQDAWAQLSTRAVAS
ncbi:MAG: AAA family ATPase [Sphingomonadales bacterium]|nr:AAA family ATPase [Sphingomonadales bacterium]